MPRAVEKPTAIATVGATGRFIRTSAIAISPKIDNLGFRSVRFGRRGIRSRDGATRILLTPLLPFGAVRLIA